MPRRGRHRTSLPTRLIAAVAALLVTAGVVVAAGSAAAQSDSGSGNDSGGGLLSSITGSSDEGSSDSDEASSDESGDSGQGGDEDSDSGENGDGQQQDGQEQDGQEQDGQQNGDGQDGQDQNADEGDQGDQSGDDNGGQQAAAAADPFPGRDQIANASGDDYVDINDVEVGDPGEGGDFSGASYTVDCGVSDHNNSDNYMAAPGKRNGAQHVHDYVGNRSTDANSDDDSLEASGTSCGNGDQSTFFWPVLRDRTGAGPDVGEDGGSRDGNVGSILTPTSADLTFHGHGDVNEMVALPRHLMMIMGNAKQGAQNGDNVNSKYTCSGFTDRITDRYPVCPSGSNLMRILDYPSCWDGQNLESANFRDHMAFAESDGSCANGFKPIPALRITLTYAVSGGRNFQIDSFPNEQHNPLTDHSDFENLASETQNERGLECIRGTRQECTNIEG